MKFQSLCMHYFLTQRCSTCQLHEGAVHLASYYLARQATQPFQSMIGRNWSLVTIAWGSRQMSTGTISSDSLLNAYIVAMKFHLKTHSGNQLTCNNKRTMLFTGPINKLICWEQFLTRSGHNSQCLLLLILCCDFPTVSCNWQLTEIADKKRFKLKRKSTWAYLFQYL